VRHTCRRPRILAAIPNPSPAIHQYFPHSSHVPRFNRPPTAGNADHHSTDRCPITAAIAALDSPSYRDRNAAPALLRSAGHAVYQPLRKTALATTSAEFHARADPLLNDLQFGLTTATPPRTAAEVRQYRDHPTDDRYSPRIDILPYILLGETNPARRATLLALPENWLSSPSEPALSCIRAGDFVGAQRFLDLGIEIGNNSLLRDSAAFAYSPINLRSSCDSLASSSLPSPASPCRPVPI
jgi:hypothetical protein